MKRTNVFLLVTLVVITGIILTGCGLKPGDDLHSGIKGYCPYCKRESLKYVKEVGPGVTEYQCNNCRKQFRIKTD
jgi:hypothetical protein